MEVICVWVLWVVDAPCRARELEDRCHFARPRQRATCPVLAVSVTDSCARTGVDLLPSSDIGWDTSTFPTLFSPPFPLLHALFSIRETVSSRLSIPSSTAVKRLLTRLGCRGNTPIFSCKMRLATDLRILLHFRSKFLPLMRSVTHNLGSRSLLESMKEGKFQSIILFGEGHMGWIGF